MTTDAIDVCKAMIDRTSGSFRANKGWADKAITQLPDEKLHIALDANTNSIAVIMKHVAGNLLSRWTDFLTTDGEKPWRNRDDEFVDTFGRWDELIAYWDSGWQRLFDTLSSLSPNDLAKTIAIQRSLAHACYHVGQIKTIYDVIGPYLDTNLERFEINFMRDLHPESEVAIWINITAAWIDYHDKYLSGDTLPDDEERNVLGALLAISMGMDDVSKMSVSEDVGRKLLECYEGFGKEDEE